MRNTLAICLFSLLSISGQAGNVQAVLKNNVFYAPATGTYVEADILVIGNSITYIKNARGKYNGAVEVVLLYEHEGKVAAYDKYMLNTADIEDTANATAGIIDKKRYALAPGEYTVDATFTDVNSKLQKNLKQKLTVSFDSTRAQFSDISLVEKCIKVTNAGLAADGTPMNKDYIKSGLFMTPMVLPFFPDNANHLRFYAEAYNTKAEGDSIVLAMYSIRNAEGGEPLDQFSSFRKIATKAVLPLFGEFDITTLPSGKYDLVLQIRDKNDKTLCQKKLPFSRSKFEGRTAEDLARINAEGSFMDFLDKPALKYELRTLKPIADADETEQIKRYMNALDVDSTKAFLLRFWTARDSITPFHAWLKYEEKVDKANALFATSINYGFETERGRVYLQYGPPNHVTDMKDEPAAFPYQIWQYYNIPNQGQGKFVFYCRDHVTNEYELIHSTARGELRNDQWEKLIYNGTGTVSPDDYDQKVPDHWGGKATERYTNP